MKLTKLFALSLVALGLASTNSRAVTPTAVSYQANDLFLGFRATGGVGATKDYLVNIGQASLYKGASGAYSPSVGNIGADLVRIYGPGWYNRSDLLWSISGTPGTSAVGSDPAKTLYATAAEIPAGTQSSPWKGGSSTSQGAATGKMISLSQQFLAPVGATGGTVNLSTTNSLVAIEQDVVSSNSYASFMPGGANSDSTTAFRFFNPTVEGDFTDGAAGSVLDLYRIPVGYGIDGTLVGTFVLDNTGKLTFTPAVTAPPPTVATLAATGTTYQAATLNATVNPNGLATTVSFEYGFTTAYDHTSSTQVTGTAAVSGTVSISVNSLFPSRLYHFHAVAVSTSGSNAGSDLTFTTAAAPATPPLAITGTANPIGSHSATLSGTANANGVATNILFEYGPTTAYETGTVSQPLGSGTTDQGVSTVISGLASTTGYHFRLIALSVSGTSNGSDASFTTAAPPAIPPTAVTGTATGIGFTAATVNGAVNPNEYATLAYFEIGKSTAYELPPTSTQPMGSGSLVVSTSGSLTGLTPATGYHYRLVAVSTSGTTSGNDGYFVTAGGVPAVAPVVTSTLGVRSVTVSSIVSPNGFDTKARFQYGRTVSYGSLTAEALVPSGSAPSTVSVVLPALIPHTTYHIRCSSTNARGTIYSADKVCRTLPRSDINGDGYGDLIAINTVNKATTVLCTRNGVRIGSLSAPVVPATLSFCGEADFNGDGKLDWVLFDTRTRRVSVWTMNGATFVKSTLGPLIPAGYDVTGVADMNNDGKPDLILLNKTTGRTAVWTLNGYVALTAAPTPTTIIPIGYTIVAVEDLNGDGKPDFLIWNPVNKLCKLVLLNPAAVATALSTLPGPAIPAGWQLAGADAFTAADTANWLIFNPTTRATIIWNMRVGLLLSRVTGPVLSVGTTLLQTK